MKTKTYQHDTALGPHVESYLIAFDRELAERTIESYEATLAWLAIEFATTPLTEITTADLTGFIIRHWGRGKAAPATQRQRTAAIKSFFKWCDETGLLGKQKNPAANLRSPKVPETNRRAHEQEIIDQLIDAQPNLRDRIALQLTGHLGLRRNELRLLKLADIDLANDTILVRNGKGGRSRIVHPTARLKADLKAHQLDPDVDWDTHYLVYPWDYATTAYASSSMHDWFHKCLERAGLSGILLHELRHTAATELLKHNRGDHGLIAAQRLLGHKSVKTTETYLHYEDDLLKDAIGRLETT